MKILSDIGGTYARFVKADGDTFTEPQKYRADDFETLEDALQEYCSDERGELSIATAAYEDGDVWQFVNQNKWVMNPASLKENGWDIKAILNDFAASTWGLIDLDPDSQNILHEGESVEAPKCLIGPGTGLGLGYLVPTDNGPHVQRTHGGHMIATAATEEQWLIMKTVRRQKGGTQVNVFEHFVSGPGLYNIYSALNLIAGKTPKADSPEEMLDHKDDACVQDALRLFHEFFGLFARTVTITGHSYGGLYLTGGVLERLKNAGLFDFELFQQFFTLPGVDSATDALQNTPIIHVTDPHLAMNGLLAYERSTS